MGKTSTSGQGRPKGSVNKLTASVKEMLEGALSEIGGKDYFVTQATANPAAFLSLVGKLMPKDINLAATINVHDAIVELAKRKGE